MFSYIALPCVNFNKHSRLLSILGLVFTLFLLSFVPPALANSYFPINGYFEKADGSPTRDREEAKLSWLNDPEFGKNGQLYKINAEAAYILGITGSRIGRALAIIDTGLNSQHSELPKITSLNIWGYRSVDDPNCVNNPSECIATGYEEDNTFNAGDYFYLSGDKPYGTSRFQKHGAGVGGALVARRGGGDILGVAFGADGLVVANNGMTGEDGYIYGPQNTPSLTMPLGFRDANIYTKAFRRVTESGVRIISNSWGDGAARNINEVINRYNHPTARGAYDAAARAGRSTYSGRGKTIMVFVTGNYHDKRGIGHDPVPNVFAALPHFQPDLEESWIAVGALDSNGYGLHRSSVRCKYAKYWCVLAPSYFYTTTNKPGEYFRFTITSSAAPLVSGALALVMERFPYLSNEQAREVLLTTANQFLNGGPRVSDQSGWGKIDLAAAMRGPGEFFGEFDIGMPAGRTDVWSNNITDRGIRQRARENPNKQGPQKGSLIKRGRGTLVLSGDNTYGGGTQIMDGTLIAAGGHAIPNNGELKIEYYGKLELSDDETVGHLSGRGEIDLGSSRLTTGVDGSSSEFSGSIRGAGGLTKRGRGTFKLSGYRNTYTGYTDIEGGTLIAAGGNAIPNDGELKIGYYGKLELSDDETVGHLSGRGKVDLGSSRLTIGVDGSSSEFSGSIRGAGGLIKRGRGKLILDGNLKYSGETRVEEGTLELFRDLSHSPVTISRGAMLKGGRYIRQRVTNYGTLSPGHSVGTMNIHSGIFNQDSELEIELSPTKVEADRINSRSIIDIRSGTKLRLKKENQDQSLDAHDYYRLLLHGKVTILDAGGGIRGRFDVSANKESPFLKPSFEYTPNKLYLSAKRNNKSFASFATSADGKTVAAKIDALDRSSPLYKSIVTNDNPGDLPDTFSNLSGRFYSDSAASLINNGEVLQDEITRRIGNSAPATSSASLYSALPMNAPTVFFTSINPSSEFNGNSGSLDYKTEGFMMGLESRTNSNWKSGAMFGYTKADIGSSLVKGLIKTNNYNMALYSENRISDVSLKSGISYTLANNKSSRGFLIGTLNSQSLSANYGASMLQIFSEASYRFSNNKASLWIEPFTKLTYIDIKTGGFKETGGIAALRASSHYARAMFNTAGIRLGGQTLLDNNKSFDYAFSIGWQHALMINNPSYEMSFSNVAGSSFRISGPKLSKNILKLGASANFRINENAKLFMSYTGQISRSYNRHSMEAGLSIKF